jgi:hypothetical protein
MRELVDHYIPFTDLGSKELENMGLKYKYCSKRKLWVPYSAYYQDGNRKFFLSSKIHITYKESNHKHSMRFIIWFQGGHKITINDIYFNNDKKVQRVEMKAIIHQWGHVKDKKKGIVKLSKKNVTLWMTAEGNKNLKNKFWSEMNTKCDKDSWVFSLTPVNTNSGSLCLGYAFYVNKGKRHGPNQGSTWMLAGQCTQVQMNFVFFHTKSQNGLNWYGFSHNFVNRKKQLVSKNFTLLYAMRNNMHKRMNSLKGCYMKKFCYTGTYFNKRLGICEACKNPCKECNGPNNGQCLTAKNKTSCRGKFKPTKDKKGFCDAGCKKDQFFDSNTMGCRNCTKPRGQTLSIVRSITFFTWVFTSLTNS